MNKYLIKMGAEVLTVNNKEIMYDIFNSHIRSIDSKNTFSYVIKIKLNNKYLTYITNSLEDEEAIYNELTTNSKLIESTEESMFASIPIDKLRTDSYVSIKDKVLSLLIDISKVKDTNELIKYINFTYVSSVNMYSIENKEVELKDFNNTDIIYLDMSMQKDDIIVSEFETIYLSNDNFNNLRSIIDEIILKSTDRLNSKVTSISSKNVLLTNDVVGDIMSCFINMFHAKQIKDSMSLLTDKLDKKVFSSKITIIEDPFSKGVIAPRLFDSEGNKKTKQTIVNKGVFVKKFNDSKTAKYYNELPTGNNNLYRNIYIEPGNNNLEEGFNQGYIITNVQGTHSGINKVSGDISVQARGYVVKDNIKIPVENMILTTNILELLNNVVEVGNDLKIVSLSITMPSLLLSNISVVVDKN